MTQAVFPKYSKSKQTGDQGVRLVEKIFSETFGWIFHPKDDQKDVGIDAQVEIAWGETDKSVVGKMISLQIKTGQSFLKRKNSEGYIFSGDEKHLGYFLNYSIPVLIILCDISSQKCWWVKVDETEISKTLHGWEITVPYSQELSSNSKTEIERIAGQVFDYNSRIEAFTILREYTDLFSVMIDRCDIESLNISNALENLNSVRASKKLIKRYKSSVDLVISGYDHDSRELYEIQEIRTWLRLLDNEFPYWFYFLSKTSGSLGFITFSFCKIQQTSKGLLIDRESLSDFVRNHLPAMHQMCIDVDMNEFEINELRDKVMSYYTNLASDK